MPGPRPIRHALQFWFYMILYTGAAECLLYTQIKGINKMGKCRYSKDLDTQEGTCLLLKPWGKVPEAWQLPLHRRLVWPFE